MRLPRSKAAEAALSGKLDELSKVALADVGYFAIEYGVKRIRHRLTLLSQS